MKKIILIEGEGIGPEVMEATLHILEEAGASFEWCNLSAEKFKTPEFQKNIPQTFVDEVEECGWVLKGPITTPMGGGHKSVNVLLRQAFDTYASVRPIKTFKAFETRYPAVDFTVIRENTEGLYLGIEKKTDLGAEATRIITEKASKRIAGYAFDYAKKTKRHKVTAAHKANILKITDGLFLECCRKVGEDYPEIELEEMVIDNMCMQLVIRPEKFDVLVAPNLYGDILSDLGAGLIGGLGLVPGANIGEKVSIFEAVHGSAPDIAGKGIANPAALILSSIMMLEAMEEFDTASRIRTALDRALSNRKNLTPDLGGSGNTSTMTKEIVNELSRV